MPKKSKVGIAGKFGARYGSTVKAKYSAIASRQKQKQQCPFCKKLGSRRLAKGLWQCKRCKKKYAASAYYVGAKI